MTTLREIWVAAKKESLSRYPRAVEALRAARIEKLQKEAKRDPRAKPELTAKTMEKQLRDMGIDPGSHDVDDYFRFKEDFGPTLDKLEKARKPVDTVMAKVRDLVKRGPEAVLANADVQRVLEAVCAKKLCPEFFEFVTARHKVASVANVKWALDELNLTHALHTQLDSLVRRPADVAKEAPALFAKCRKELLDSNICADVMMALEDEYKQRASTKAGLPSLIGQARKVAGSYRHQVKLKADDWKGIRPDFRQPLLDAIDKIEHELPS